VTAYRLWPATNGPVLDAADSAGYTLGMEFSLSQSATLTGIWFWRATVLSTLPAQATLYTVADQSIVTGSTVSFTDPGTAGWIEAPISGGPMLSAATNYKVCVFNSGVITSWYSATAHYWDTGAGSGGLTTGIITAPNDSGGDGGQDTFHVGGASLTYPANSFHAGNYWIDVQVTTAGTPAGIPVSTTPVLIGQAAGSARRRQAAFVTLVNGTVPVYLGGSGVSSSNGVAVAANATWSGNLWPGDQLYAVTGSGTSYISLLQT
jgi:Domain of unknown function (DUF4082)